MNLYKQNIKHKRLFSDLATLTFYKQFGAAFEIDSFSFYFRLSEMKPNTPSTACGPNVWVNKLKADLESRLDCKLARTLARVVL